jgi:peptide/nickel transport system substrate-binding protein
MCYFNKSLLVIFGAIVVLSLLILSGCAQPATTVTRPATTTAAVTTAPSVSTSASPSTSAPATTKPPTLAPATTSPTAAASPSKYGGVVKYITANAPGNPFGAPWLSVGPTVISSQLCLQPLLKEESDGTIVPCLASSYDVSTDPNNPSISFHLRQGVKFSDGSDFNAQAAKWSLQQQMAPGSVTLSTTQNWKSVDAVDNYTLKVNFKSWQNTLVRSFSDNVAFMVSPTAFQKNGADWMNYNMVGTGPFLQKDFQRDVSLTTIKNPNYWEQGKPYLDGVQMLYVADQITRESLFKAGGGQVLDCGGNAIVAADLQSAGYKIVLHPGSSSTGALIPDSINADSPWSNLKVRQAAEYAIDKDAIAKGLGYGFMHPVNQLYTPESAAYDSSLPGRTYDVAKAKQLLTEAGYPNGFKSSIMAGPMSLNKDLIVALQAYLAKVGIQCDIQYPQSGAWSQISTGTWHNALLYTPLQLWANPNVTFNYFFGASSVNYQSLKKPDGWNDMLTPSLATASPDPAMLKKMEAALYNDATFVPLTFTAYSWAVSDKLQDSGIGARSVVAYWEMQDAWLSK